MSTAAILICPPHQTRDIMEDLRETEFSGRVWTPFITRRRRLPRTRKTVITQSSVLPGYLFYRDHDGYNLPFDLTRRRIRAMTTPAGTPVQCPIEALQALQNYIVEVLQAPAAPPVAAQAPAAPPIVEAPAPVFAPGTQVVISGRGHLLDGVSGAVLHQTGEEVLVWTEGFWGRLKISAFLLQKAAPINGNAAGA